jgi:hypothetical protein
MTTPTTIRVVIPLKVKRRNGRPRIVPPDNIDAVNNQAQDTHLLRAIARAWAWRQMLERGEVATIQDVAAAEKVSDRFVGRMLRLAYLSPMVLEKLLLQRRPPAVSIKDLAAAAELPWRERNWDPMLSARIRLCQAEPRTDRCAVGGLGHGDVSLRHQFASLATAIRDSQIQ